VTLLTIAISREGSSPNRMARPAGLVHSLRHPMISFLVIDRIARLRENLRMAGVAFALHPLIVLPVRERNVAVLGLKYDGFRRHARR
jgi:hypothetical protein